MVAGVGAETDFQAAEISPDVVIFVFKPLLTLKTLVVGLSSHCARAVVTFHHWLLPNNCCEHNAALRFCEAL
jgi:hypothetical protein